MSGWPNRERVISRSEVRWLERKKGRINIGSNGDGND